MCQAGDVNAVLVNPSLPPYASNGTLVTPMTATSAAFDVIVQAYGVWDTGGTLLGSFALDPNFPTPNGLKPYSPPNDQWRVLFNGVELAAAINTATTLNPVASTAKRGDWGGWKIQAPLDLTSGAGLGISYIGNGPLYSGGGYTLYLQRETFVTVSGQAYARVGIPYRADFCLYGTHLVPPPSGPPIPTGLTWPGVCEGTRATLSWNASVGATSYALYRDGMAVYIGGLLQFTDAGLTIGQAYSYTVAAIDGTGTSLPSSPVSVTPCAAGGNCCAWGRIEAAPPGTWGRIETPCSS